jgi:hypothetical protein
MFIRAMDAVLIALETDQVDSEFAEVLYSLLDDFAEAPALHPALVPAVHTKLWMWVDIVHGLIQRHVKPGGDAPCLPKLIKLLTLLLMAAPPRQSLLDHEEFKAIFNPPALGDFERDEVQDALSDIADVLRDAGTSLLAKMGRTYLLLEQLSIFKRQ